MNHYDEDIILKFVLEILDEEENALVKKHIEECTICNTKFNKVKSEIDVISSFDPNIEDIDHQIKLKSKHSYVWLKRAAVLIFGFLTGYLTSTFTQPEQVNVVEQKLIPKTLQVSSLEFAVCSNVDIW
ncbi:MAG: hypothetical protein ABFS12_04490 [Bacteroidota bacterium]